MELAAYLQLLRRWWLPLIIAAWVAGILGFLAGSQIPPTYESRARMLIGPVNSDVETLRAAEALAQTYAELATTESQLRGVIERVGLDMEPIELEAVMSVTANPTTRILTIRAVDTDAGRSAAIADAVGEELIELASAPVGRPESELTLVDRAGARPAVSVGPSVSLMALLAGAAGLLLTGIFASIIEYLGNTVKGRHDVAQLTGAPLLGEIRFGKGYAGPPMQPLVVEAQPESRTALGYRLLVSRMPMVAQGRKVRSLLVVGAQAGDGRGEFSANLAAVLVRTGRSVTLVDADDLEAQVTRMFDMRERIGLAELLEMPADIVARTEAMGEVQSNRAPGVDVIPTGNRESQLMQEESARRLLEAIKSRNDIAVISAAPIHRSASSLVWARVVDAVVLVVREETTQVENLRYAVESLRLVDADLVGSVLLERRRGSSRRARRTSAAPRPAHARPAPPRPEPARDGAASGKAAGTARTSQKSGEQRAASKRAS